MKLNSEQIALVNAPVQGLTIGAAMAGTGKSTTIVERAKKILTDYPTGKLLMISFTRLSAEDLRKKLKKNLTEEQLRRVITGTFHSVMGTVIRNQAIEVGLNPNFSIIDEYSTNTLYKRLLDTKIGENGLGEAIDKPIAEWVYSTFDWNKHSDRVSEGKYPYSFSARNINTIASSVGSLVNMAEPTELETGNFSSETLYRFAKSTRQSWNLYQHNEKGIAWVAGFCYNIFKESILEARKANVVTYDQILFICHLMTKSNLLDSFSESLLHTIVDEAQDTNALQFEFIDKIAPDSLTLVGDVHQSIYSFRGGRPDMFLKYMEKGIVYPLSRNYRSFQPILDAGNDVIAYNTEGREFLKRMTAATDLSEDFRGVVTYQYDTDKEEAEAIIKQIKFWHNRGVSYVDMAILVRSRQVLPILNKELQMAKIPLNDTTQFADFMKSEVMIDTLNFLKILINPQDIYAFLATLDRPKRGIGEVAIKKIEQAAAVHEQSVIEFILSENVKELTPGLQKKVKAYRDVYNELLNHNKDFNLQDAVDFLLDKTGYLTWGRSQKNAEAFDSKIATLTSLVDDFATEYISNNPQSTLFDQVNAFTFDMTSFVKEETPDGVTIATIHGSKGLEWDTVFMPGMEEEMFPGEAIDEHDLEDQRRLMYVGTTRARKHLVFTHAKSRVVRQDAKLTPSRFLKEANVE